MPTVVWLFIVLAVAAAVIAGVTRGRATGLPSPEVLLGIALALMFVTWLLAGGRI